MKDRNIAELAFQQNHFQSPDWQFASLWNKIEGIIPADYKEKLDNFINNIDKNAKLEDNETVYISPISELPSYKLKNYIEENKLNINTARKIEKLDTIVISESFLRKNYLNIKKYDYNKGKWITDSETFLIFPISTIVDNPNFKKYIPKAENYYYDITYITRKVKATHYIVEINEFKSWIKQNSSFREILTHKDTETINGYKLEQTHGNKKVCDALDFVLNLLDNIEKHNIKIVLDNSLQEDINKGLVVDYETFETLYGMLRSSDMDSWEVAKEIIANCEFEASKPYLIFLYYTFAELRKRTLNKNHMFVRNALHKFYDGPMSGRDQSISIDRLIVKLGERCPQYLQQQMPCLVYHMNSLAGKTIIKEITLA
jgi:hypothetical protein